MLSIYPACFFKEKEGNYSVIFPVLGIATCGDTINETGFVNMVTVDVDEYAKKHFEVKKTLTIPSWLNDLAVKDGVNFSQVLQKALKEQLHITE